MYAIIKFTDEEKSRIVSTEDIKHFDLPQIHKKKFLVKYEDGSYYPAQVVIVKDSIEELEEFRNKKRLNFVNRDLLQSASESESELSEIESRRGLAARPAARTSLFESKPMAVSKNVSVKDNKKKSLEIKDKKIQESFLSKYHDMSKYKYDTNLQQSPSISNSESNVNVNIELQKLKDINRKLSQEIEDLKAENKEILNLNIELQKTVIDQFKNLEVGKSQLTNKEDINVGAVVNDQVHLGRGVYLSKACFNDAWFRCTSGAHFVKTIAVYLFGSQTLMNSSVTGKSSNNYKKAIQKPALDATKLSAIEDIYKHYLSEKHPEKDLPTEIKLIKTYIANKISDLNRTTLRQKKRVINNVPDTEDEEDKENEREPREEGRDESEERIDEFTD